MLVLIAIILAAIPLAAILYPFIRRADLREVLDGEETPYQDLARRWDAALAGLRSAELERSIGALDEEDYGVLRTQYMSEAALVLKALEVEKSRENELLEGIEEEVKRIRENFLGHDGPGEDQ